MTLEAPPAGADRILVGTAATLYSYKLDGTGEPVNPGTVTVTVTGADGNAVVTAQTASEDSATYRLSYALTAAQNNQLDWLTAVWTDASDSTTWTTYHEVVGGFYFTAAQARAADAVFADGAEYPTATLVALRDKVEREFESPQFCGRAFVPRFMRERVSDGYLSQPDLRRVRSVTLVEPDGETSEPFTSAQVATIPPSVLGVAAVPGYRWPVGDCIVEYEYGLDRPPSELLDAVFQRARYLSSRPTSGTPSKATTYNSSGPGGGSFGLAVAGRAGFITGMDDVDLVIKRYRVRPPVG